MVAKCQRVQIGPFKPFQSFKPFKTFKTFSTAAGSTLVELLLATLLTSAVMGAMYHVYRIQTHSVKLQEGRLEAQEYGRAALDLMVREMRNVGHFPVSASLGCTPLSGGIVTAAAQTFSFNLDADGNGNCLGANEGITYAFSGGNITRTAGGGATESLTDGNVTALEFRYFKQDSTELSRPVALTELPNIQRVSISLTVQSKKVDSEFGAPFVVTMNSNVDLRNRGL